MILHNTRTRAKEALVPLNAPDVTFYSCGPTVYNYPHIGNWFTFLRWDILVRTLKASGLNPTWVMNITDVGHLVSDADDGEDKLEVGAKREGKTAWDVAAYYSEDFVAGLKKLNFTMPDKLPKATDHITEQIELVSALEKTGHTYVIDDGVYFDTATFPSYAEFAKLQLDELKAGARVEENSQKRNPSDFALWKFSPKDQQRDMEWESPWGKGFPGWHIECSAMSMKYLGETLDIHAGGIDHIPVHHTNEIAQSEAATGKRFSNVWLHGNFIKIDGQKISKSLGNFYTLADIEAKGFAPEVFRLLVLESHYRSEAHFSWEGLQATANRLKNWQSAAVMRWQLKDDESTSLTDYFVEQAGKIVGALENDLDTPLALSVIDETFSKVMEGIAKVDLHAFVGFLQTIDDTLGLSLLKQKDINDGITQLIRERQKAKQAKDFAKADNLRSKLTQAGIAVRDTPHGPLWSRI